MNLTRPNEDELVLSFGARKKFKPDDLNAVLNEIFGRLKEESEEMLNYYERLGLKVGKTLHVRGDDTRTSPARAPVKVPDVPDKEGGEA